MASDRKTVFNGINARSGSYLFDPMSASELARIVGGSASIGRRYKRRKHRRTRGVKAGIDAAKLEDAGWGVIFAATKQGSPEQRAQDEIVEALSPLLALREEQASKLGPRYREYRGKLGYRPGESKLDFMGRIGVGVGPADPTKVPYYLLIVGSPEEIPFQVQRQIDVQYAVGRIHFDTTEEYAAYARSVVAAEREGISLPREIAFVGVANPDDDTTQQSREQLVVPLAKLAKRWARKRDWTVSRYLDERAAKAHVSELFGGASTPALMFTASHGVGFDADDPLQRRHQGALLLQDWPGPEQWKDRPIDEAMYLSGDDLRSDAGLHGLIAFNFACYGGGTPRHDEFSRYQFGRRETIAKQAFVAGLHRKMLGHPKGGALAAIGHVDRAWSCSFMWETGWQRKQSAQLAVFESTLETLMEGKPVGVAMEYFNERYAEIASDLSVYLERFADDPERVNTDTLASLWVRNNDARGYGILGDPAVRLRFRDELERAPAPVVVSSAPSPPSVDGLVSTVLRTLTKLAEDREPLEVRTYLTSDVEAAAASPRDAHLGALTRIGMDGNTELFLAERDGAVDPALIELHQQLVEQVSRAQLELIRAIVAKLDPNVELDPSPAPAPAADTPALEPCPPRYELVPSCPRYLVVAGLAASFPGIDTYKELAALWADVEGSQYPIEFVTMVAGSARETIAQVSKYETDIDVIHLASHGQTAAVEFPDNSQLTPATLAKILAFRKQRSAPVSMLYINTCHSAAYVEELGPHVPVIVAANGTIGDEAALAASNAFYRSLASKEDRYEVVSAFDRALAVSDDNELVLYIEGKRVR